MMMPNASESEIEQFKKSLVENVKHMMDNPAMMDMMQQQMRNMAANGGNPMMNMGMGNPMNNQFNSPMGNQMNSPMNSPMNNPMNNQMNSPYQNNMNQFANQFQNQNMNNPLNQNMQSDMSLLTPCSHGYYHPALLRMAVERNPMQSMPSAPPMTDKEAEEKYSSQLDQMYSMGYTNKRKNLKALKACKGNLEMA